AARRPLGGSCGADGTCQSAPFVTLRERRHQYNWGEAQGGDPPMALWRRKSKQVNDVAPPVDVEIVEPVPIAPDDPLLDYLQKLARPIEVEKIEVESPALEEMKAANIELLVPLVTQGEL